MKIPGAYSQRDGRWGSHLLGYNSPNDRDAYGHPFDIANYGCLVTALANLLWYMGHPEMNPDAVNNTLKARSGFVQGGVVVWGAANGLADDLRSQGTSNDLAAVENFVAKEGNFAILQVTKVGFPMHFVVLPLVGAIIDSWDGVLKPVGSYQFVTAHLYSDVTPDFTTTPQPATSPAPQPVTPEIQFTPLNQDVKVIAPDLEVRTGPGLKYPGHQANTSDHILHAGQVVHVTGVAEGDQVSVIGGHPSHKWLRSATNPAHYFAASGTEYEAPVAPAPAPAAPAPAPAPETPAPVNVTLPQPNPPAADPAPATGQPTPPAPNPPAETPAPAPAAQEVHEPTPQPAETSVPVQKAPESSVVEVSLNRISPRVVYISNIESGKHVEKVPASIPFKFIYKVTHNGIEYGVTANMSTQDPLLGVDLAQFKTLMQDVIAPAATHGSVGDPLGLNVPLPDEAEVESELKGFLGGAAKLLHRAHKDKSKEK